MLRRRILLRKILKLMIGSTFAGLLFLQFRDELLESFVGTQFLDRHFGGILLRFFFGVTDADADLHIGQGDTCLEDWIPIVVGE